MLNTISANGFKDQVFSMTLSGLDLFTSKGLNGVGKSSRLEAALLLAMGYLPNDGSGNTVESVLKYTTGDEIEVAGKFQTYDITRRFSRKAKNKRTITINEEQMNYTEGQAKVNELLGFNPMMVDITEFMNMSNNKKIEFVLKFSPEGMDLEKSHVKFVTRIKLLSKKFGDSQLSGLIVGVTGESGKRLKDLSVVEANKLTTLIENMNQDADVEHVDIIIEKLFSKWSDTEDVQDNLKCLIEFCKKERTIYDRKVKDSKAGAKKLNETIGDMETITGSISDLKLNHETITKSLSDIVAQIAGDKEKIKAIEVRENSIEVYKKRIGIVESAIQKRGLTIGTVKESIKKLEGVVFVGTKSIQQGVDEKKECVKELRNQVLELKTKKYTTEEKIKTKVSTLEKIKDLKGGCPLLENNKCSNDMGSIIRSINSDIPEYKQVLESTANMLHSQNGALEKIENEITGLEKEILSIQNKESNNFIEITSIKKDLKGYLALQIKSTEELTSHKSDLEKLQEQEATETGVVDIELLEKQSNGLQKQLDENILKLEELERQKGILIAQKQIQLDRVTDEIYLNIYKSVIKILGPEGLQGEIVEALKGPLEKEVNSILSLLNHHMTFKIDLKNGFEMGWFRDGKLIPFTTLNQAHHVILVVAFLTAIINRFNPPLKLMCIEAAELGMENLTAMMDGLTVMKKTGKLDNVLVAHHQTLEVVPCEWVQHVL